LIEPLRTIVGTVDFPGQVKTALDAISRGKKNNGAHFWTPLDFPELSF